MYCCEALFQMNKVVHVEWEKDHQWGNMMLIPKGEVDLKTIIHSFVMIYMTFRLGRKMKDVAKSVYFYTNEEELNRIYESTTAIFKDTYYQANIFPNKQTLYTFLFELFTHHLQYTDKIHFDALALFCMKPLDDYIVTAVGFGIDEMKREEAYQDFIVNAREFVLQRRILTDVIHIVQTEELQFYKADGILYSKSELQEIMHQTPLYIIQLDEEEFHLAPVISLAPKQIYLYSDQPIEGKTYTLCRIFQERIQLNSLHQFPFSLEVN